MSKFFERRMFIFIGKNTCTPLSSHGENTETFTCTAQKFFGFEFFYTQGNLTKCVENKTVEHSQKYPYKYKLRKLRKSDYIY